MRFEISIKNKEELGMILELIQECRITKVNLVDKTNQVENSWLAHKLLELQNDLDITLCFSIKNRYSGNPLFTFQKLQEFIYLAAQENIIQYLIISGNPKRQLDAIKALEYYATDIFKRQNYYNDFKFSDKFFCAYNPSLGGRDLETENQRLVEKINTKIVSGVYLQISSNEKLLLEGINHIKSFKEKVQILGSILIPTISILKSLEFRPWHGVELSPDYLESLEKAEIITQNLFNFYNSQGVEPVVTIIPFNKENLKNFYKKYQL